MCSVKFSWMGKVWFGKTSGWRLVKLFDLCLQDKVGKADRLDMEGTEEEKNITSLENSMVNDDMTSLAWKEAARLGGIRNIY